MLSDRSDVRDAGGRPVDPMFLHMGFFTLLKIWCARGRRVVPQRNAFLGPFSGGESEFVDGETIGGSGR